MKVDEAAEARLFSRPRAAAATRAHTRIYTSLLIYISLLDDDVHQPARNHANLYNLLASDRGEYFSVGEGYFFDMLFRRVGGNHNPAAHFAVDLHGEFDFVFLRERGVVLRPWCAEQTRFLPESLPKLVREVGRERCEHQDEAALGVGQKCYRHFGCGCFVFPFSLGRIHGVEQFHDRGDASVEVPAPLEVVGNALDGLVKLTLQPAGFWRQLGRHGLSPVRVLRLRVAHDVAIDASQKTLYTFN